MSLSDKNQSSEPSSHSGHGQFWAWAIMLGASALGAIAGQMLWQHPWPVAAVVAVPGFLLGAVIDRWCSS